MASNEEAIVPGGPAMVEDEPQPLGADVGAPPRPKPRRPSSIVPLPNQQGAAFVAAQRDPARHAKVVDLASRLNMSPGFVDQNYDALAKVEDQHDTQTAIDGVSPTLRNWLSDPDNASIAKHEIGPLAQVDKGAKLLTPRPPFNEDVGPLDAVGTGIATGMSDLAKSTGWFAAAFGHATPDQVAPFIADMAQRSKSLREQAPDYAKEFNEAMALHEGNVDKAWRTFIDGQPEAQRQGIMRALVEHAKGGAQTLGETLSLIGAAVSRPKGLAYQGIESLASMAPMLAGTAAGGATGAAIGSIVPGAGTAVGGAVGAMAGTFAGIAPINVGAEIEAELQKRGVDPTDVNQVKKALSDPQLMAVVRGKALAGGLTSAGVMALFQGFAGKLTGVVEKAGAGAVAKGAAHAGEAVIQAGGVAAGQEAGAAAQGEPTSPGRAISTTLQMLGVGAASEALGASRRALLHPETASAGAQVHAKATDALRAQHDAQVLTEVGQAVKEAQTTGSVPDRLKSLIETATGGQDAATVYFQSGDWDKYWQSQGSSPAKAAADVMGDDGKAYHDAQATGARLAIPLSDYISRVATTNHFEGLIDVARTRPDGMSFGEAREYLQSLPATMKELADEATAQAKGEPEPLETSAQQVRLDVEDQLLKAGFAPVAAKSQAQVYESAFRTLGAREGVSARELFNRYGLTIGRGPLEPTPEATATLAKAKAAAEAVPTEAPVSDEAEAARLEEAEGGGIHVQELPRPRTASGRLKNLAKASAEEIANEYRILIDANATEISRGRIAETDTGDRLTVGIQGSLRAGGRIAARAKTIAKLEAEMAKRGMDQGETYMSGSQNARAQAPDAFPFGALEQPAASGENPRGVIDFTNRSKLRIQLLEKADKSTFLHETSHFFTEVVRDLVSAPTASEGIKADWATLREWVGAEGDKPLNAEQHEQIARGFEAYLMEGKAPSVALRSAFYRFKNWLLGVYKNLRALNVELTPEVRGVFDRLLASKEEIEQARQEQHAQPLFSDQKASGMNDQEWAGYLKADAEAKEEQESKLTTELMKQIRLEESKEWNAWRDPIKEEVTKQIDDSPLYKAIADLKRDENPVQLDRAAVKELLGDQATKVTRKGYTSEEGGLQPDVVADLYGFASGRELLDALSTAPSRTSAIEQATDARMQAEHGERLTDAEVSEKASAAVNGDKRALLLRREAEALAFSETKKLVRMATRVIPPDAEVKAQAASIIGSTKVREVRPDLFEKAAARLGKESLEAVLRGDRPAAFDAKIKQILAVAVAKAATDAKARVETAIDQFKKVFRSDSKIIDRRDLDLVNAARVVLGDYGIGPRSDKRAEDHLSNLKKYEPDAYESVAEHLEAARDGAPAAHNDYRDLATNDFDALAATVKSLWELSRRSKQVQVGDVRMEKREVVAQLTTRFDELQPSPKQPGMHEAISGMDQGKMHLLGAVAAMRRAAHLVRALDGGSITGPFRTYIYNIAVDAQTQYLLAKKTTSQVFRDAIRPAFEQMNMMRSKYFWHAKIDATGELGYTFSGGKNELLHAIMHTGNGFEPGSNGYKLLVGRGWGDVDENGAVDTSRWKAFIDRMHREGIVGKADYDAAQAVWDHFERLKPGAQQAHRTRYGRYFDEITNVPFQTPFGEYKGGYVPATVDARIVPDAAMRNSENQLLESMASSFPSVGHGFTKTRSDTYAKPLLLDASSIIGEFDKVLRFTYLGPAINDVGRILMDREFANRSALYDQSLTPKTLVPWLKRVGSQQSWTPVESGSGVTALNNVARFIRNNSATQILVGSPTVLAEQVTHMPALMARSGGPLPLANALWKFMMAPRQTAKAIYEMSDFMKTRDSAGLMEAHEEIRKILIDPNVIQQSHAWLKAHERFLMAGIQDFMDKVGFMSAYDHASETMDHDEAVREAEATVTEVLGGYTPGELSNIEAGTPMQKLFTMFSGFFINKTNMGMTEAALMKQVGLRKGLNRALMVYVAAFAIPAMLGGQIKRQIRGESFEHEDESALHAILRHFFGDQGDMLLRGIPYLGSAIDVLAQAFTGGKHQPDLISSPALKMTEDALRAPGEIYHALADDVTDKMKQKAIVDIMTLAGMLSSTPLRPLAKAGEALINQGR